MLTTSSANSIVIVMKSPDELAGRLTRQWESADHRERRLLSPDAWPLILPIGRPSSAFFENHTDQLRLHVQRWRTVAIGEVSWEAVSYRSGSEPVDMPLHWILRSPSEWVTATGEASVGHEYRRLECLVAGTDSRFHRLLLRQRHLLQKRPDTEVIQACRVALAIKPGIANGRPLRALGLEGADSKFFERNRGLMIQLLDVVFDGLPSELGLEPFLGALDEADHWLLVAPLEKGLLPFAQQRLRVSELINVLLPASRILIVENESCLHQLPIMANTIAILGAGLNLGWMQAEVFTGKNIAYWGDIDTWGLVMLAKARSLRPDIHVLLMQKQIFDLHQANSVREPYSAGIQPPNGLTENEKDLYCYLITLERGRLEQEFLPKQLVSDALQGWGQKSQTASPL